MGEQGGGDPDQDEGVEDVTSRGSDMLMDLDGEITSRKVALEQRFVEVKEDGIPGEQVERLSRYSAPPRSRFLQGAAG